MKSLLIRLLYLFILCTHLSADTISGTLAMQNPPPEHPRLFLSAEETPAWREHIAQSPFLETLAATVVLKADQLLNEPPLERVVTGRRLLDISRIALKRIVIWSTAYRLTEEKKYADRAIREMLHLSKFTDWNPGHFLDVAEMTAAMAIGYDWLYAEISEANREEISNAIIEKGLRESLQKTENGKDNWWVNGHNNWNQVCNAGMTLGALAIWEEDPELARTIINRAANGLPYVMKTYAPDGAYVEGASYWNYGTTFNVLFLDAVEHALGTDFGLSNMPGFLESADYMQHIISPCTLYFNYSDSGGTPAPQPAMYWMAAQRQEPSLLWHELDQIDHYIGDDPVQYKSSNRLTPFILLWSQKRLEKTQPLRTHWHADGKMPVAFHRSGWTPDATYIAMKGGSPSLDHAHMDVGSFVLEMNGVRWAVDLGGENYHEVERRGLNLWDLKQDSDRWEIFRLGSFSHNILTVNREQQRVDGNAPVLRSTGTPENLTVMDLSPVYHGQLASALRSASLTGQGRVIIKDHLKTLNQATSIRWAMMTNARVTIISPETALLEQEGKKVKVKWLGVENTAWQVREIIHPPRNWESKNPNTRMLYFTADLPPNQEIIFSVEFTDITTAP